MWEFWIDVGGTFTDCLAQAPDRRLIPCKILSSGITKGRVHCVLDANRFRDPARIPASPAFWVGYGIRFLNETNEVLRSTQIVDFDSQTGTVTTAESISDTLSECVRYEIFSDEEAPLIAIRMLLGLRRDQPIPAIAVRLGTTRGTNALLTRRGARTAFITTRGFGDILRIANQDRPRLFDLAIKKPTPLFEAVVEIDERIAADGQVLQVPDPNAIRQQLTSLKQAGIESVAICLLHAFAYPQHEQVVASAAREVGFAEVSLSGQLAPLI